jgi:hypothetical protein
MNNNTTIATTSIQMKTSLTIRTRTATTTSKTITTQ